MIKRLPPAAVVGMRAFCRDTQARVAGTFTLQCWRVGTQGRRTASTSVNVPSEL